MNNIEKDGFLFEPYLCGQGYQCKIKTKVGTVSIRYGSLYLFADKYRPYEVWYPTDEEPRGYQTAKDIRDYLKSVR